MTPFTLDIILHYYGHADDHPVLQKNPPIWAETRDWLIGHDILLPVPVGVESRATYCLTEKARSYVRALLDTPFPVQVWVMPDVARRLSSGDEGSK